MTEPLLHVAHQGVGRSFPLDVRQRVLVVENDPLICDALADDLVELGCIVVGPAGDVPQAVRLAGTERIHFALLDVSGFGNTVAAILDARNIPFVFMSGFDRGPEGPFRFVPVLSKPFSFSELRDTIATLTARAPRDLPSSPLPILDWPA